LRKLTGERTRNCVVEGRGERCFKVHFMALESSVHADDYPRLFGEVGGFIRVTAGGWVAELSSARRASRRSIILAIK
jgi:hypothetical protein